MGSEEIEKMKRDHDKMRDVLASIAMGKSLLPDFASRDSVVLLRALTLVIQCAENAVKELDAIVVNDGQLEIVFPEN